MESRQFLPSGDSKYLKDYFEAVGHFNKREWPETLAAAKAVLTNKNLPRALQIKSHILIFVATSDWKEANEARQAAEKIWKVENDRIEVERRALGRLREALDELDKDDSEEEDLEIEDIPKDPTPHLRSKMKYTKLFPSSTSKHLKDYFEAADHYNDDRFSECIATARINLTDETCPRALQIKNNIIISAATTKRPKKLEKLLKGSGRMPKPAYHQDRSMNTSARVLRSCGPQ